MTTAEINRRLTIEECAAELKVSWRTISRAIAAGEIETVRIGRCVRIEQGAVDKYLSNKAKAKTA